MCGTSCARPTSQWRGEAVCKVSAEFTIIRTISRYCDFQKLAALWGRWVIFFQLWSQCFQFPSVLWCNWMVGKACKKTCATYPWRFFSRTSRGRKWVGGGNQSRFTLKMVVEKTRGSVAIYVCPNLLTPCRQWSSWLAHYFNGRRSFPPSSDSYESALSTRASC